MCVHHFYYEMGGKVGICKLCGAKDISMNYGELEDYIEANMLNFIMRRPCHKVPKRITREQKLERRTKLLRERYGEDIKTSRELGLDYNHSMYAYKEVTCPCGDKRYVRIVRGRPERLYCKRCVQKLPPKDRVKLASLVKV